jgi:hypothetical protein
VARFNDKDRNPVTLIQNQEFYEGTPSGALVKLRKVFRPTTIWSTIVNGSVPFTILFKHIKTGFLSSKNMFLPFTETQLSDKEIIANPLLQTPVVATLNSDYSICENISRLSLSCQVDLTYKAWITLNCPDMAGKCTILPVGNETGVFIRSYGMYGDTSSNIGNIGLGLFSDPVPESVLTAISQIRKHIIACRCSEKVVGQIPAPWVSGVYALSKAVTPMP